MGQGWRAVVGLAFIPLYIRYLGIEAYGLIGIFAVLQAWMTLLDMGMRPALMREMARFSGGGIDVQSVRDLLRSVETLALLMAAAAGGLIWSLSGWLASDWFRVQHLQPPVVSRALTIMGFVAALRFLETIYISSISGLQRQVLENVISTAMATVRAVGAVAVLMWVPTISAFFAWQGLISLLTVILMATITHQLLPRPPRPAQFSWDALKGIWRFAAGMIAITVTSLLLTQVDKMLLSRLVPLETFGYYALAGSVASALYILSSPISTAFYPRFVELSTRRDEGSLRTVYHQAAQLLSVIVGAAAAVLLLFADRLLLIWTGDPVLVANVAPLLIALTAGALLNAVFWVPYYLQLAHGWTRLMVAANATAVTLLVPAILFFVPIYGAISAAWVWVALNVGYVIVVIPLMHRRLLPTEKARWYVEDVGIPLAAALAAAGLARLLLPHELPRLADGAALLMTGALVLCAAAAAAPKVREIVLRQLGSSRPEER